MAQRIVTLCDAHQASDEEVAGAGWEVTLRAPGGKPQTWEIDLCEDDGKTLADLATMLTAVGRQTAGPKVATRAAREARAETLTPQTAARNARRRELAFTAPGHYPCPHEDCTRKTPTTKAALSSHLRHYHQETIAEATGQDLPYVCPECGRGFSHPQGRGTHRRTKHGVLGVASQAGSSDASDVPIAGV